MGTVVAKTNSKYHTLKIYVILRYLHMNIIAPVRGIKIFSPGCLYSCEVNSIIAYNTDRQLDYSHYTVTKKVQDHLRNLVMFID